MLLEIFLKSGNKIFNIVWSKSYEEAKAMIGNEEIFILYDRDKNSYHIPGFSIEAIKYIPIKDSRVIG